jgi:hypothetical protein
VCSGAPRGGGRKMHQGTADQGMLGAQGKGAYGFVCSCKVQETGESVAVKKVAPPAP